MDTLTVNLSLYGDIARYAGGRYVASLDVAIFAGATFADLLQQIGLNTDEKGYVFINAVLCDAPGLNASENEVLKNGDHIGIFSITHMWPYQYRDGVHMSDSLRLAMAKTGAMHNSYRNHSIQNKA